MNYYNENDPKAAAWLRELIKEGHIAPGVVDERSITDIRPDELTGFVQLHFFAGIGGWPLALRLAGWPDNKPVGTGSCPCPPFSAAGKKKSCPACGGRPIPCPIRTGYFICLQCEHAWFADARHLWPELFRFVRDCGIATWFGEQVAGEDGLIWLAGIRATMERIGRSVGSADLAAAGRGAPHLRQRLFWVGHADSAGPFTRRQTAASDRHGRSPESAGSNGAERMGNAFQPGLEGHAGDGDSGRQSRRVDSQPDRSVAAAGLAGSLEYTTSNRREQWGAESSGRSIIGGCGWSDFDILPFRDGKFRRVEPGSFPLAHGVSGRVGLLRGYGNAIVPQVAAEFIQAFYEAYHDVRSDVLMSDPMF